MASEFEDIKIVAMDDQASYKDDPATQMMNVVLTLSASAPHEWAQPNLHGAEQSGCHGASCCRGPRTI